MMAAQKKQRPLIRYAGSAAETSIGSKPIGSELENEFYSGRRLCQVWPPLGSGTGLSDIQLDIPQGTGGKPGRYTGLPSKNQRLLSTRCGKTWAISRYNLAQIPAYRPGLSQRVAPNGRDRAVTLCHGVVFGLAQFRCLSQTNEKKSDLDKK